MSGPPIQPVWYEDDGHSIELEPHRDHVNTRIPKFGGKYVDMLRKSLGAGKRVKQQLARPDRLQRCIVRVNYARGGSVGKWYSVGKYIARESATDRQQGFNQDRADIDLPKEMAAWHRNGDEMFFKLIISPEFGDRVDLQALTKEVMDRMEGEWGALKWMAVEHHNTDNPHVHVLLSGRTKDGQELRFPREYIQQGIRAHAENVCTNQLGFRTEQDIIAAQQREVRQARFTGLDRQLLKRSAGNTVTIPRPASHYSSLRTQTELNLRTRLKTLEDMGLATKRGGDDWMLDAAMENSLRAMQRTVDRQKMMNAHGILSSDKSLGFRALKTADIDRVEGRVLVHGQEEHGNGIRNYMLVESVTGEILQVPQTFEVGKMRAHGELEPGTYLVVAKLPTADDKPPAFDVESFGDAGMLLTDKSFLRQHGSRLARTIPAEFGGWLGQLREQAEIYKGKPAVRSTDLSR